MTAYEREEWETLQRRVSRGTASRMERDRFTVLNRKRVESRRFVLMNFASARKAAKRGAA